MGPKTDNIVVNTDCNYERKLQTITESSKLRV